MASHRMHLGRNNHLVFLVVCFLLLLPSYWFFLLKSNVFYRLHLLLKSLPYLLCSAANPKHLDQKIHNCDDLYCDQTVRLENQYLNLEDQCLNLCKNRCWYMWGITSIKTLVVIANRIFLYFLYLYLIGKSMVRLVHSITKEMWPHKI